MRNLYHRLADVFAGDARRFQHEVRAVGLSRRLVSGGRVAGQHASHARERGASGPVDRRFGTVQP